jgi:pimeloyl-ACP methyl ester carboxylesterase
MRNRFQRGLHWLKRGLLVLLALVVAVVAAGLLYRSYAQWRIAAETRITAPNGIESLETVELGSVTQWIYVRGKNRDNPVLLFLHGGPGSPELPLAREFGLQLEEHFVVVHWDQRASGKSAGEEVPPGSLTIERYVADTLELIDFLRTRFEEERIYLLGHSWGSVLGTLVARDRPELLHAYVGMGQVVSMRSNEQISYEFVMRRALETGNENAIGELSPLTPPYEADVSELFVQRKWLEHFGGVVHEGSMLPFVLRGVLSPEYSLLEVLTVVPSLLRGDLTKKMYAEMLGVNFLEQARRLEVPVYFLTGRYDHDTPFELVEQYYEVLEAPRKEIIWFERSAHIPNLEEPERFQEVLISRILRETYRGTGSEQVGSGASSPGYGQGGRSSAGANSREGSKP